MGGEDKQCMARTDGAGDHRVATQCEGRWQGGLWRGAGPLGRVRGKREEKGALARVGRTSASRPRGREERLGHSGGFQSEGKKEGRKDLEKKEGFWNLIFLVDFY